MQFHGPNALPKLAGMMQVGRHAPVSNAERQRQFRQRHPDYNRRYKAQMRARMKAYVASLRAEAQAIAVKPRQLALPAPVEMPIIPGMNTIQATPTPAPVPIELRPALGQDQRQVSADWGT